MASSRYLDSAAGNDANGGTTWADAKATLAGIDAIDTAGDTIYVAQTHSETTAAAVSYALAGTVASPTQIICGNKAAQPPTAVSTAGVVTTTGNSAITITALGLYAYGVKFISGSGASGAAPISIAGTNAHVKFESCSFQIGTTSSGGSTMGIGAGAGMLCELLNCTFKFGATGQSCSQGGSGASVRISGGSILSGSAITTFLSNIQSGGRVVIDGFDFTNAASSMNVGSASGSANSSVILRNCKMPGSWSGSLCSTTPGAGAIYEMINCDSADTHYRYRKATHYGTIQDETTLIRSGGASDGTTGYSYKCITNANAQKPYQTLDGPGPSELAKWNAAVGSPLTITVSFLHDSLTNLKSDEIWLDAMYLGTSGVPLGSWTTSKVDALTAGSDCASDSGSTWTTTGMTNPNKQKLTLTFTPQEEGYIYATVRVGKASYTVYVDPKIQ